MDNVTDSGIVKDGTRTPPIGLDDGRVSPTIQTQTQADTAIHDSSSDEGNPNTSFTAPNSHPRSTRADRARRGSFGGMSQSQYGALEDLGTSLNALHTLESSAYDQRSTEEIANIHKRIDAILQTIGKIEGTADHALKGDLVISRLKPTLESFQDGLQTQHMDIQSLNDQLVNLETSLEAVAEAAKVQHANITKSIKNHEKKLLAAIQTHATALEDSKTAVGDVALAGFNVIIVDQQKIISDSARAILRLRVQENRGMESSPLLKKQIEYLQIQLNQTTLEQDEANPASTWTLTNPWATEQDVQKARNRQALRSVANLAKNPAFSHLEKVKNIADLRINVKMLDLMNMSSYALFNFNKVSAPVPVLPTQNTDVSADLESQLNSTINPLLRRHSSATKVTVEKTTPVKSDKAICADIVNQAVIDVMRVDLAAIQREAGGLIGSPNPDRQYYGKVLMVLALAIATIVAAVAIMSMLGVATPAFIVPYLAAIQSTTIVSTVLNFVAAKLAVDLNTAAAVTAVATAGVFGLFGKVVHYSGAPTCLKSDLDRAAQDMEAALKETPAARMTPR